LDAFSCQYSCSGNDPLSSLEELLRGEAQLFSSFEILLNRTNTTIDEKLIFLDSFEDLLRRQHPSTPTEMEWPTPQITVMRHPMQGRRT